MSDGEEPQDAPRVVDLPQASMTYNTPNSVWTPERVERLKELWNAGELSCAGIAADMGHGISRNAVIGKALRLFGPMQKHRSRQTNRVQKKSAAPRPVANAPDQTPDPALLQQIEAQTKPASFLGIALIDLEPRHCRYPRTVNGSTLFCGQPKIHDSAYCIDCHRRCHTGNFGRTSSYVIRRRAA